MGRIIVERVGLEGNELFKWSKSGATAEAIKLYSLCGTMHPASDQSVVKKICNEIMEVTLRFAIQARRVLEVAGIGKDKEVSISEFGGKFSFGDKFPDQFSFKDGLWYCINGILHARRLSVLMAKGDAPPILACNDGFSVCALEIESDYKPTFHIEPYAMTWAFLLCPKTLKGA